MNKRMPNNQRNKETDNK